MTYQIFILLFAVYFSNPKSESKTLEPKPECKIINEPASNSLVWKSNDNGKSWQDIGYGLPFEKPASTFDITNEKLWLSIEKNLYQFETKNNKDAWKKYLSSEGDIYNIFQTRSSTYLFTYPNGILKLMPDGTASQPKFKDMNENFIQTIHELKDGSLLLGTQSGVYKSVNDGKSWTHVYKLSSVNDIVEIDNVLISGGSLGLLKSIDGGNTWKDAYFNGKQSLTTKIFGNQIISLSRKAYEDPGDHSLLFPFEDNTYDLLISNDSGKTWSKIGLNFDPTLNIIDVCMIDDVLYCSVTTGIFKSDDKGQSWKLIKSTDKNTPLKLAVNGKTIYAVKTFVGC